MRPFHLLSGSRMFSLLPWFMTVLVLSGVLVEFHSSRGFPRSSSKTTPQATILYHYMEGFLLMDQFIIFLDTSGGFLTWNAYDQEVFQSLDIFDVRVYVCMWCMSVSVSWCVGNKISWDLDSNANTKFIYVSYICILNATLYHVFSVLMFWLQHIIWVQVWNFPLTAPVKHSMSCKSEYISHLRFWDWDCSTRYQLLTD